MEEYTETQRKILEVGKKEFLAKGFKDASLRGIVKEAGFTQGHFTDIIQIKPHSLTRWYRKRRTDWWNSSRRLRSTL